MSTPNFDSTSPFSEFEGNRNAEMLIDLREYVRAAARQGDAEAVNIAPSRTQGVLHRVISDDHNNGTYWELSVIPRGSGFANEAEAIRLNRMTPISGGSYHASLLSFDFMSDGADCDDYITETYWKHGASSEGLMAIHHPERIAFIVDLITKQSIPATFEEAKKVYKKHLKFVRQEYGARVAQHHDRFSILYSRESSRSVAGRLLSSMGIRKPTDNE